MSKFGKFLVVFLLLLSAVFAGAQMVLYARRQNYYEKWQNQTKALADLDKRTSDNIASLESQIKDLEKSKTDLKLANSGLNANLTKADQKAKLDNERIGKLDATVKEMLVAAKTNADTIADRTKKLADLRKRQKELDDKVRTQMGQIGDLAKQNQDKANEIAQLKDNIGALEKTRTNLSNALKSAEAKLSRYALLGVALPEEDVPVVDARVLKVNNDLKVIVLSVGKKNGVKVAHKFTVYRGTNFVAEVIVNFVDDGTCVAQPVLVEKPILVGDVATTRI